MEIRTDASVPAPAFPSFAATDVLMGDALRAIIAERVKQVDRHGFTIERDQVTASRLDLALAGASYANAAIDQLMTGDADVLPPDWNTWPWDAIYWNPKDPRANLIRAAALIWAAIDWLDHAPREAGDAVDPTPAIAA